MDTTFPTHTTLQSSYIVTSTVPAPTVEPSTTTTDHTTLNTTLDTTTLDTTFPTHTTLQSSYIVTSTVPAPTVVASTTTSDYTIPTHTTTTEHTSSETTTEQSNTNAQSTTTSDYTIPTKTTIPTHTTTTEQSFTVPTVSVKISTDIAVATTITYSAALLDTSSEEYAKQSANVQAIFQSELESVASTGGGTLDSVTVTFSESTSRRRRRSSNTDAVITADYSFEVPASSDISSLTSAVASSTSTAANSAISSSAGTYMSTSAVTSVSSSVVVQTDKDEITTAVSPCPSTDCWTYDETTNTCSMTGTGCATLLCTGTGFEITFRSEVFNLDDGQSTATFAGGLSPTWDGSKWVLNVSLGEIGMTHNIDVKNDA